METIPPGYRQSFVTAISVFLAFALAFIRFWAFESKGSWDVLSIISAIIIGVAILLFAITLFRALNVKDELIKEYKKTLQLFKASVIILSLGVIISALSYINVS